MTGLISQSELRAWLISWVVANVTSVGSADDIDLDRPLSELGMSSRDAVSLAGELEELLDRNIAPTLVWQVPTVNGIVNVLVGNAAPPAEGSDAVIEPVPGEETAGSASATQSDAADDLIAVVGVGCRFPGGVSGPETFWDLLTEGRDALGEAPAGRWESFVPSTPGSDEVLAELPRYGGFLADVAGFDADFFGISPREALLMDPQQRLMLEVAWEALEHAGIAPESLRGTATGVFVGISSVEYNYLTLGRLDKIDAWGATGSAMSIVANRISYLLDLRGPSMAIDTACSSSLTAIHQACRSLRDGESDVAIVGGVNLLLGPAISQTFNLAGALSTTGVCTPFGSEGTGMVRGEGCGAIVLKRLSQAHHDGDRVLAVVRGSATNSDGRSNGLTAPNPSAQEAVLRTAYANAGLRPADVGYVEAHGTGTPLGDPIEAGALGAVLGHGRAPDRPLHIGSVKSNIGHLEAAAGVAGAIKAILSLWHGQIPASLHARSLNPHIDFDAAHLHVVTEAIDLPRYSSTAVIGVSGFGFGGTNVHVVFSEDMQSQHPDPSASDPSALDASGSGSAEPGIADVEVLTLSANSPSRLVTAAMVFADWIDKADEPLYDIANMTQRHRNNGTYRAAFVGRDKQALSAALRSAGTDDDRVILGRAFQGVRPDPVWVFSGYGSQWPTMGSILMEQEPVFADAMDEVAGLIFAECDIDVLAALSSPEMPRSILLSQLTIFATQIALAALWRDRGCEPAAVVGNSMGEITAAAIAGALSLPDAVKIMYVRSELMANGEAASGGAMAVASVTADEFAQWAPEYPGLSIAVHSSPAQCTIGGPAASIAAFAERLEAIGRDVWVMKVGGAAHSSAIDVILDELAERISTITPLAARIPIYSTVYGEYRSNVSYGVDYWLANIRQPVLFTQAIAAAAADGHVAFVELSPHPIAFPGITETLKNAGVNAPLVVGSLRRGKDDALAFAGNAALLSANGVSVRLSSRPGGRFVDLPRQRWNHQQFWADSPEETVSVGHPLLGEHVELPDGVTHLWSHVPGMEQLSVGATEYSGAPVVSAAYYVRLCEAVARQQLALPSDRVAVTDLDVPHRLVPSNATQIVTSYDSQARRVEIHARERSGDVAVFCASAYVEAGSDVAELASEVIEKIDARSVLRVDLLAPPQLLLHRLISQGVQSSTVMAPWDDAVTSPDRGPVRSGGSGSGGSGSGGSGSGGSGSGHEKPVYLVIGDNTHTWLAPVTQWLNVRHGRRVTAQVVAAGLSDLSGSIQRVTAEGLRLSGVVVIDPAATGQLRQVTDLTELDWLLSIGDVAELAELAGEQAADTQRRVLAEVAQLRAEGIPAFHASLGTAVVSGPAPTGVLTGSLTDLELGPALDALLRNEPCDAAVTLLDPDVVSEHRDVVATTPLLAAYYGGASEPTAGWCGVDALRSMDPAQAVAVLLHRLRDRIAMVMGADSADVDIERPLVECGFDSLMATRARNAVEQDLGIEMQARVVLQGAGVRTLALHLCKELGLDATAIATPQAAAGALIAGAPTSAAQSSPIRLAPRDPAERFIALVWQDVLSRTSFGVREEFFSVGGDDAKAVEVQRLISERLGQAPTIEELMAVPTIAVMADLVRPQLEGNSGSLARVLNAGYAYGVSADGSAANGSNENARPPLFLFHPAGGPTTVYQPLVSMLDLEQPVYGFERIGDVDSVEERVDIYLPLLREIAPTGPYRVGGWSLGGVLAYEMARRLTEMGEEVELLAMIDPRVPEADPNADQQQVVVDRYRAFGEYIYQTYGTRLPIPYDQLGGMSDAEQLSTFLTALTSSGIDMPPAIIAHQYTSYADTQLAERYTPQGKYEGLSVLYHASAPDPVAAKLDPRYGRNDETLGWDELCSDLQVVHVSGNHISVIDRPNVDAIAAHLNAFFAESATVRSVVQSR